VSRLAGGSAERLRLAAASVVTRGRSRGAMLELFLAIRELQGDDLARWSGKLASPLEPSECAAVVWERLMSSPSELTKLAGAADPCRWLWSAAAHEPTPGIQRSNGWLFDYAGGYGSSSTLDDCVNVAFASTRDEPHSVAFDASECSDARLIAVARRVIEVLGPRTPAHLRAVVAEAVEWMMLTPIEWGSFPTYVRTAAAAFPELTADQAHSLVTVLWGSRARRDMSLLRLFLTDCSASVLDHGPVYRAVTVYKTQMHGTAQRRGRRPVAA
jgi:hypothetical protein